MGEVSGLLPIQLIGVVIMLYGMYHGIDAMVTLGFGGVIGSGIYTMYAWVLN